MARDPREEHLLDEGEPEISEAAPPPPPAYPYRILLIRYDRLNPQGVIEHQTHDYAEAVGYLQALQARAVEEDSFFYQSQARFFPYFLPIMEVSDGRESADPDVT